MRWICKTAALGGQCEVTMVADTVAEKVRFVRQQGGHDSAGGPTPPMAPPPVPPVGQAPGSRGPPTRLGQPCTAVCTAAQRQQKVGPDLRSGPAFRGSWAWDSVIAYRGGGGVGIGPESPPSPRPDVTASGLDVRFHAHADLLACGVLAPFINHQPSPDERCTPPSRFNIRLHVHPMGPGGLGDGGVSCPYPALIFVFTFMVYPSSPLLVSWCWSPRCGFPGVFPAVRSYHLPSPDMGFHLHGRPLYTESSTPPPNFELPALRWVLTFIIGPPVTVSALLLVSRGYPGRIMPDSGPPAFTCVFTCMSSPPTLPALGPYDGISSRRCVVDTGATRPAFTCVLTFMGCPPACGWIMLNTSRFYAR